MVRLSSSPSLWPGTKAREGCSQRPGRTGAAAESPAAAAAPPAAAVVPPAVAAVLEKAAALRVVVAVLEVAAAPPAVEVESPAVAANHPAVVPERAAGLEVAAAPPAAVPVKAAAARLEAAAVLDLQAAAGVTSAEESNLEGTHPHGSDSRQRGTRARRRPGRPGSLIGRVKENKLCFFFKKKGKCVFVPVFNSTILKFDTRAFATWREGGCSFHHEKEEEEERGGQESFATCLSRHDGAGVAFGHWKHRNNIPGKL